MTKRSPRGQQRASLAEQGKGTGWIEWRFQLSGTSQVPNFSDRNAKLNLNFCGV